MPRFLDRRSLLGSGLAISGAATIAATLALTGPATTVEAGTGSVFLVITLSDSGNGQLPAGATVTVTAHLSNSAANTNIGDATPTVTFSYDTNTLSELGNASGWTCSTTTNAGQQVCTDGTITAGGSTTLPISFSVASDALIGDNAFVTGTVSDAGADINSGSFSGQNVATDSATIANGTVYTKDAPAGAYPSKVGQDQVVSNNSATTTMAFTDGSVTIDVGIPAGALLPGTHVAVYKGSSGYWNSSLSSRSQAFVNGYAAAWTDGDENTPSNAASSLTLVVHDPAVKSGDTLYQATTTGLGAHSTITANSSWIVSFTQDPGFVLAQAAAAPTTSASSSSPAASSTITAPSGGGGPASARGGSTTLPISAGVLLVVFGVAVLGTGRRRRDG